MKIENKLLYDIARAVKTDSRYMDGIKGLYIEGYNGGVTIYATDGKALFRKNITGNNQKEFAVRIGSTWAEKTGETGVNGLEKTGEKTNKLPVFKDYFETGTFNHFTVEYKEFRQALKAADAVNRGAKTEKRNVVISGNNGKINIASWTEDADARWQLDGDYGVTGAICIGRQYLDLVKADYLEFSFLPSAGRHALRIGGGGTEAVIMERVIEDTARFFEVLEYEYIKPEPVEKIPAEPVVEKSVIEKPVITERKTRKTAVRRLPVPKKENGAFSGWSCNKLGTKRTKVLNW